jgi:hypothetical protein
VASALSAEKYALRRAPVSSKIGDVLFKSRKTFVKGLELDSARKQLRRAIARYMGAKRCTGGKCEGQVLIGYMMGEAGDVEESFMQVGMGLGFGRFVGFIGWRVVVRCHDSERWD